MKLEKLDTIEKLEQLLEFVKTNKPGKLILEISNPSEQDIKEALGNILIWENVEAVNESKEYREYNLSHNLACAILNFDYSGLSEEEKELVVGFVEEHGHVEMVRDSEEFEYCDLSGLMCEDLTVVRVEG